MHGTVGGRPPRRQPRRPARPLRTVALDLLVREAGFGALLYAMAERPGPRDLAALPVLAVIVVAVARYRPLVRRGGLRGVAAEGIIVLCGALVFRGLLARLWLMAVQATAGIPTGQ